MIMFGTVSLSPFNVDRFTSIDGATLFTLLNLLSWLGFKFTIKLTTQSRHHFALSTFSLQKELIMENNVAFKATAQHNC